jgi:hypothetical protein
MNILEKQAELGKSLYEINTATVSEITELSRKNVEQYFEVNRAYGEKLPEVREIGTFLNLQREYGETLWNNARAAMEAQNSILQHAFTETRDAFQSAFTAEQVEAPKKTAKKAKAAEA